MSMKLIIDEFAALNISPAKRYRLRCKDRGLCHCSRPLVPGKSRCEKHLKYSIELHRKRKDVTT